LLRGRILVAAVALLASGCATKPDVRPMVSVEPQSNADIWKDVASDADENRLGRLGLAWSGALQDARRQHRAAVEAEGALLQPRAALPRPSPTPGSYNCRLVRLGRTTAKAPAFEKFKPFYCYVQDEGDQLSLTKQTGSERPVGRLWDDDRPDRMIFLGIVARPDEGEPPAYGEDPRRNVAGVFERIAPFRWRLVIPWPQGTAKLDVYELTPVADQPEG
jgi:hypothetical protein